jgi:hypothetical protein
LLRYFRINDPYRLLGLLLILVIIYLPLFIDPAAITLPELKSMLVGEKMNDGKQLYVEITDSTAPFAAWFHGFMDMLFGRSLLARHIIAFVIIFFQSAFLGIMFITKKAFGENTFIPSLIFSILYFFSFDNLALTDELLGSGFMLLAMFNVFSEMEFRGSRDETVLNLGLFVAMASLFYFPFVIFLFAILIILFLFARTGLRKILLLVFGFLLPHVLMLTIAYMNDGAGKMWQNYYLSNLEFGGDMLVSVKGIMILGAIPIFYFVVSMVMLNRQARFSKYQSQLLQTIFLWIGFSFIFFLFCPELRPQSFVVLIPALSFLFTHFLLLIKRKKFAEMNTWILLIGLVTFSYLARYDKLSGVSYDRLTITKHQEEITQKRVLVLGNEPEYYVNNKAGSSFINWDLAEETFTSPEYFESVSDVYTGIKSDPPDVIVDKQNLLMPFLERIPEIKNSYKREGQLYRKISN